MKHHIIISGYVKESNFPSFLHVYVDFSASKLYLYFDMVADKINQVHHKGGKMIVYCRAGMSRSAALCIAYFMKYHGMTVDAAFQYVRERRPIIHPNTG
jgi:atypical dual specificity phosphatase